MKIHLLKVLSLSALILSLETAVAAPPRRTAMVLPNISYATPQVYYYGTPVTPLIPTNTGGAVGAYGAAVNVQSITNSNGITIDPATGNRYITSSTGNTLGIYNSSGTLIQSRTGFTLPAGVILDASGSAYVANRGAGTVTKITTGGVVTTITGFTEPTALTIDPAGNIYVVDRTAGNIYKITGSSTTAGTPYITGFSMPWGIVSDAGGNLYISEPGPGNTINKIFKVLAGSTTANTFVSAGVSSPRIMTIDGAGNIFEADAGSSKINMISPAGVVTTIASLGDSDTGIALDGSGNIFATGYNFGEIYKLTASGYTISPALPAGLYFDNYNGVITGTPTVVSPSTNYTVTATNASGSYNAVVNITVDPAIPVVPNVAACGAGNQTITASGGLPAGGTYNWFSVAAGGTALQSSTATTYTPYLNATANYYVSYTSGGLTTPRTAVTATVNPTVSSPLSGMSFAYPFNSGSVNDISGNNNTGTLKGSTLATPSADRYGAAGSAYTFDGVSQYISTTTKYTNPTVFTLSIWFNTTTTSGGKLIGFDSNQPGPTSGQFDRHIYMNNAGQLYFGTYNGGTQTINSAASYNDGKWHHAVITFGPARGSVLYVDGSLAAQNAAFTTPENFGGYWRVGGGSLGGWPSSPTSGYFAGQLDDIGVYSTEQTAAQVGAEDNLNLIAAPPACIGNPITFSAQTVTGATYSWSDPSAHTATGQNPTFPSAAAGTYTLTVTGGPGGCSSTASIMPTVVAAPSATFTAPANIFATNTAPITYTGSDPATSTYAWTFTGGTPATGSGQGPFSVTYATAGSYTVALTITNATGCSTTANQVITVNPAPTAPNVSVCGGSPVTVTASGGLPAGGIYNWYNVSSGGTALQSTTSNTYTTTASNNATFYVSYTSGSYASARTPVSVNINPAVTSPISGAVFSYPFSGNANDVSGNVNTGIIGGATLTSDRYGAANSAYSFNGSSNYITTTTQFNNPTVFTISLWFNTTVAGGKLIGFGSSQTGASGSYDRQLYMSSTGQLNFGLYNGATNVITTTGSYNDGNWHHAVATLGPDGTTLYVDGTVQASNAAYTTPQGINGYWRIGYDNNNTWPNASPDYYFTGILDDIAVFGRELTATEIAASNNIYQLTVPTAAICTGSPITFGAPTVTGATYTWKDASGTTVTGQNPTFASAAAGNYTLTVTGGPGGCSSTATITPNILPAPSATFTAASPVGVNSNAAVTFTGTYAATSTYNWNFGGGTPSTGTGQGPFNVQWGTTGTKTITLTVTNASGCSASATQTVNVIAAPNITNYGNYAFSRTVTLNTTSAGITSNLSNFPALLSIQLNDLIITGNCTDKVQIPNGPNYDFAFIDPTSSSELYYQVESYNKITGTLLVWVQIPNVSYASNNAITFYYGSKSPTVTHNTAFFQKTWPGDYQAVYHFNDAAYTGTTADGTANAGVATLTGFQPTDFVTGKIGMAYNFGGAAGSPTVNSMTATPANVTTAFTESAWVILTIAGNDQKILTNQNSSGTASGGYKLGVFTSNIPETEGVNVYNRSSLPNPGTFSTGTWYYVQGVYDGATMSTYVNGVQYKKLAVTGSNTYTNTLYIGIGEGGQYPFSGTIDEPRISNVAKTSDWLMMEYTDQNNPVAFTNVSPTYTTYAANAAAIPGALTYTWTGATSTDPAVATNWNNTTAGVANQLPAFNGSAALVIPAGVPSYPKLTASENIYSLTIANGAALNLNGYTLSVGCHIYNSAGGQILYGGNAASGITWNGTLATQYYYGSAAAATGQTGNMTISNTATAGTVNISSGNLDVYNTVTLTSGNLVITAPAVFTLKSLAAQTAAVAAIPAGSSITGSVTAERYLDGGANYRSYRMLSSPVSTAVVSSNNVFSLNYIQASMYLTGSSGGGFDKTGNPTLYLYREDLTPSNVTYTSGNFLGISAINNSPSYNYYLNGGSTAYNLPAGSGYLCFFRGNRAATTLAAETTVGYVPATVTMSTTGTLNQGPVTVHGWYTPATSSLGYTSAAGNAAVRGYNMVGNPYASSIDWSKFSATSTTAAIYGPNVAPAIYEFDPLTKNYATYNAVTGISTGNGGSIISSGQGFFVQALGTSASLTFNETAKTTTQVTGSSLLLALRRTNNQNQAGQAGQNTYGSYMRLKLETDTINYSDVVIGFNPNSQKSYNPKEDSKYLPGMGGSRQGVAAISSDSVKTAAKWLSYPKNTSQVIRLSVSVSKSGLYTIKRTDFKAIPGLYEVWLMDKYKKDSLDIKHNTDYAFDADLADTASYGDNRFTVVIREDPALGLHLLSFTAAKTTAGAQVNWKVENEANYTNFEVERSTDNITFTALGGYLSGSQGTYNYTDSQPVIPADSYRLKLTDVNGNITYSQVVTLSYGNQASQLAAGNISIYPNPSKGMINLAITGSQAAVSSKQLQGTPATAATQTNTTRGQVYGIKIISITGMVLKQTTSASPTWQADVSGYMPGTYVIQVVNSKDNSVVGKGTFVKL